MIDFGLLFNTITDPWFESEPLRIVWLTKLLRAVDGDGTVEMSRAKFGKLFNCTADAAFYFLQQLEKRNLLTRNLHAICTQITICNIKKYDTSTRKLHANYTQEGDVTRNLHAICTQANDCETSSCNEVGRNLDAIKAQKQRKEIRKENALSPVPPIIKENNKEKKTTLTLSSAPDFVSDSSTEHTDACMSKKELEKQRKAEERKAKAEEKKQQEYTLVHKARLIFEAYYHELYEDSYYWSVKDAMAMKRLIKKITFGRSNRAKPLPCDDDSLLKALDIFLRMINKTWIMNNFSVGKIDSQYNDIVSEIKNKNNMTNGNIIKTQQTTANIMLANQAANILNDIAKADELYYRGEQGSDEAEEGNETFGDNSGL